MNILPCNEFYKTFREKSLPYDWYSEVMGDTGVLSE